MILNWLIYSSYTPKRSNLPLTPPPLLPLVVDQFSYLLSAFSHQCSLVFAHFVRVAAASLSNLFFNFNISSTSHPVRALRSPSHTPSLASSYAVAPDHARFGVRSSSGRVGVRYTALRKASLRLVRFPQLLVRH